MKKEQFDITGMTCSACSSRVEGCVVKLPGVKEVSVNLLKNSMLKLRENKIERPPVQLHRRTLHYWSLNSSSFSVSVISTTPRDSLTIPSFWK